ncbi:hypothetical protein AMS68_005481 [Peltaster fructicola]|uniref:Altered inheritance of mitochondria protein 13, mitochondrial n=1 Tax=Peltaster fructicola TaxID=286661 RepID=A0A6H0XYZ0_9PEZI|nr:hypothetical protein AMS68_005481 [Peltaster fructicola]
MGNGNSKQEQHVFNADGPVRFSQSVLDKLQQSSTTDSTRAQDTELKIQQRVNDELKRIRDSGAENITKLTASLTTEPAKQAAEPERDPNTLLAHLSSPFYQDHTPKKEQQQDSGRSHETVSKEVAELRAKLESRKKVEKTTPELDKARSNLVSCLRTNDRRPLDCWEEVETFKAEVGKLEKKFVQSAGR